MARRGNVQNIVNEALDAEYYDYGDEEQYDQYDDYGAEYVKPKKGKKGKNAGQMAYEEDLGGDDDENQDDAYEKALKKAMDESIKSQAPKKPKGPDP